jgi:hypothetical protein
MEGVVLRVHKLTIVFLSYIYLSLTTSLCIFLAKKPSRFIKCTCSFFRTLDEIYKYPTSKYILYGKKLILGGHRIKFYLYKK